MDAFHIFLFICLRIVVSNTCFCFVLLRCVYPMLSVSLDCPFWLPLRYCLTFIHHAFRWNNVNLKLNNNQSVKSYPFINGATFHLHYLFVNLSGNFTFLFYCNRALLLHWKGNKSVIRFLPIVLVSNSVSSCHLWSVARQSYPHTCCSQCYLLHTRCSLNLATIYQYD